MTQTQTNPTHQSPLDQPEIKEFIDALIHKGVGDERIAKALRQEFGLTTGVTSVRRYRIRHGLSLNAYTAKAHRHFQEVAGEKASTKVHGNTAQCATAPAPVANDDPDRMLQERGLDPNEWYIDTLRANEWGPDDNRQYQTRFVAKRKNAYAGLVPVRSDGWKPSKTSKKRDLDCETVVVCGDQQAPFHDKKLHEHFCAWLEYNKPDRGVLLGDLGDFPDISRHPDDPENVAKAQECLQASYDILRDYITHSPNTEWDYLPGNHEQRIRDYLIKYAPRLHGLRQVDTAEGPGAPIHDLTHLLRLDELEINLVDPHGTYENAQVKLSEYLAVRHGWVAIKGSGASALRTLDHLGYSVIIGHTHRQSLVYHTVHDIDRTPSTLAAAEIGTMCRLDGQVVEQRRYPNYTVNPDWQNGWLTTVIWPDGRFRLEHATYAGGAVYWRDQRYE